MEHYQRINIINTLDRYFYQGVNALKKGDIQQYHEKQGWLHGTRAALTLTGEYELAEMASEYKETLRRLRDGKNKYEESDYRLCHSCAGEGGFLDETGEPIEQCEDCAGRGIIDMRG